jgi:hypothetical protein
MNLHIKSLKKQLFLSERSLNRLKKDYEKAQKEESRKNKGETRGRKKSNEM